MITSILGYMPPPVDLLRPTTNQFSNQIDASVSRIVCFRGLNKGSDFSLRRRVNWWKNASGDKVVTALRIEYNCTKIEFDKRGSNKRLREKLLPVKTDAKESATNDINWWSLQVKPVSNSSPFF